MTENLLADLSHLYPAKDEVDRSTLQIQGYGARSPVMEHVHYEYPIVKTLLPPSSYGFSQIDLGYAKLQYYYNRNQNFVPVYKPRGEKWDCKPMKSVLDTYYYKIKAGNDGRVCVILK
jgi:hypothetical protein